tara:strand:+ start:75 stop:1082 length:1008 start_codon:yes stop_codon:yes gene_type:complete
MNLFFSFFVVFFFFFSNIIYSQDNKAILVNAQKPKNQEIVDTLELPGTVLANEEVKITSVVSEKIRKILFSEGSFVNKGQLLIELINDEEKAVLKQIEAELNEAELNYERARKLSNKGNISQSILDNRLMTKRKLISKIDEIKAQIEDLNIRAPFSGFTSSRNFSEGALVEPGDIIANLYDIKKLKIQAFVPENYIEEIELNSNLKVEINLKEKKNIDGKIILIDPLVDQKTRSFKILGKISNINNKIKPGMMVLVKISMEKRQALLINEGAITSQDDNSFVYIIDKNNKVKKSKVDIGSRNQGMVEILNGIKKDSLIVFEGINKIREGSIVRIK